MSGVCLLRHVGARVIHGFTPGLVRSAVVGSCVAPARLGEVLQLPVPHRGVTKGAYYSSPSDIEAGSRALVKETSSRIPGRAGRRVA